MADPHNPITLSDDEIAEVEELAAILTAEQLADYLGISRTTFFKIIRSDPEVKKAWRKGQVKQVAQVGSNLIHKANSGDVGAMCFYLKTKGGWREVKEEEKADSTPTVNINFTDAVKPKVDDA